MYFTHPQFKKIPLKLFFRKFSEANFKQKLAEIFPNCHIAFTDSGRSAFQIAIRELELENSEMLIPAYICDIFKPILEHYNIKPIYLDINLSTFNIEISQIERQITPKTKSILVCHTYGLAVEMDKILEIAQKYNLKIIEDCAHIFSKQIYRDYAFFSFAKLFPVINGGMLISKNPIRIKLPKYKIGLNNIIKFLRLFPILARFSELFRRDSKGIQGKNSMGIPRRAPRKCLKVVNYYLDNFGEQTRKRIKLAEYFQERLREIGFNVQESEDNTFTYLSALVPENMNRDELFNKLRKKGVFCSRIWQNPLFPGLPTTQEVAKRIINFPLQNWFREKDIDKIIVGILSSAD